MILILFRALSPVEVDVLPKKYRSILATSCDFPKTLPRKVRVFNPS